jgi:2,3-bisphosphoglycerate-independent phosphoglycerate mutase
VKYVIIIPDGAADFPLEQLGDATPLEAARLPNLSDLAAMGRVGCAYTTPEGFLPGSDICSMSLLGYDPAKFHTGRAPLEAAALGLELSPSDWIFRLNLVTVGHGGEEEGVMFDHSAGAISSREAAVLVGDLVNYWKQQAPDLARGLKVVPGVSYRNILVDSSGRDYRTLATTPPHAFLREHWPDHQPQGSESGAIRRLMELSAKFLPTHEVNLARAAQGLRTANMAWIWGHGTRPEVPSFQSRFNLRGGMITSVDLLAGIARYLDWDRIPCPGITGYHDTDYRAQGRATVDALSKYDVVCCHIEAPEEASHQGDWQTKMASLEAIDREIVGPVLSALEEYGDPQLDPTQPGWRMLVVPDHYTLCSTRKHNPAPVPFVMAGAWIRSVVQRPFTEAAAAESDLRIDPGHELMEYFLKGGLAAVRGRPKR